jgi:hypothetical protein
VVLQWLTGPRWERTELPLGDRRKIADVLGNEAAHGYDRVGRRHGYAAELDELSGALGLDEA